MQKFFLLICAITLFTTGATAQKINYYPVVVSFNSMCCGVPGNGPIMKLISSFKKQNRIRQLAVDSIGPMGKEGEYYLAFRLKELTRAQKIKFIQQLKKTTPKMLDNGSATILENFTLNKADLSSRTAITTIKL